MDLINMIPIEGFVFMAYLKALAYVFISIGVGVYCMLSAKRSGITDFWPVAWLILAMVHPVVVLFLYKYMSYRVRSEGKK